ncbi:MAG: TIR domain-containing protein [Acidobacteriota bacterium]|nr:TIR domain-containing protein [Acidobacteriota bacterium]
MSAPNKIFISYAHIDNEVLGSGQEGWISAFHKALEVRMAQLMGVRPNIWRDPKLQGNDYFGDEIIDQFDDVAAFLCILSPRYMTSEWCLRELQTFYNSAQKHGGLRIGNKGRIFKIIKTRVPFEKHPDEIKDLLGYEFYKIDAETGRARELSQIAGPELERFYWSKLDDVAYDLAALVEEAQTKLGKKEKEPDHPSVMGTIPESTKVVYLASTSYDLREERDAVRRDLLQHGVAVLPEQPPPLIIDELTEKVTVDLERAQLSVHMLGRNYGVIPEGATRSIVVLENELALEREQTDGFAHVVWVPPDLEVEDERQRSFRRFLETDARVQSRLDLLQTSLEDFKEVIHQKLKPKKEEETTLESSDDVAMIYLVHDICDQEAVEAVDDYLFNQGYEVVLPVFEGEEEEIRLDHQENLKTCDGVLIYFGQAGELWLRAKLRELQKIAGYGRTEPLRARGILVGGPHDRKKDRIRSREAVVAKCMDGFDPSQLKAFLDQLKEGS